LSVRRLLAIGAAAAVVAAAGPADAQQLRAKGEACAARSDCRVGLRCLRYQCVDEDTFTGAQDAAAKKRKGHSTKGNDTYTYTGGFVGGILPAFANNFGEGAVFAMRIGAVVSGAQFQLEIAPATTVLAGMTNSPMALADAVASIGYLIPISDMVSWIIRVGGGGGVLLSAPSGYPGTGTTTLGVGELRLDFFGVVIRTSEHIAVEINTPSYRLVFNPTGGYPLGNVMMTWVTGVGINYVF
jgi:hypothetical protein